MKVWEAAAEVMTETGNPAVMWGDVGLLCKIAERAGMAKKDRIWQTEAAVLGALSRNPGTLQPGYTRSSGNRRVRIFRLPCWAPLVCGKPASELPFIPSYQPEVVGGVWRCPTHYESR